VSQILLLTCYQLKHNEEMLQQGLNFKCHFGDFVAVDDNVLFLNEH